VFYNVAYIYGMTLGDMSRAIGEFFQRKSSITRDEILMFIVP